ncbi:MAG: hypothetical protein RQ745_04765 [Longimicrobiales bacterium]|nr:hypothetical protein [Longimicrobiales bacterium]
MPDGLLCEIATDRPGFLVDETRATLGSALQLPGWLEERREEIEAALRPLDPQRPESRAPDRREVD